MHIVSMTHQILQTTMQRVAVLGVIKKYLKHGYLTSWYTVNYMIIW